MCAFLSVLNANVYVRVYVDVCACVCACVCVCVCVSHVGHVQFALLWLQRLQNLPSLFCFISSDKIALSSSNWYHRIDSYITFRLMPNLKVFCSL